MPASVQRRKAGGGAMRGTAGSDAVPQGAAPARERRPAGAAGPHGDAPAGSGIQPVHGEPFARIGRTLVAADLHIGIERTLALRGFKLPSGTGQMVRRLIRAKASRLVILGDLKDQILSTSPGLEAELLDACEALSSAFSEVVLVRGNHDASLPHSLLRHIEVVPASGLTMGGAAFQHGHTRPSEGALSARTLAIAHTHPRVELVDGISRSSFEECWARFPVREGADAGSLARVVVFPAANPLCGGAPVNRLSEPLLGPVLSGAIIDRAAGEVHLLDGTSLGAISGIAAEGPARRSSGRRTGRMSYWDHVRTGQGKPGHRPARRDAEAGPRRRG